MARTHPLTTTSEVIRELPTVLPFLCYCFACMVRAKWPFQTVSLFSASRHRRRAATPTLRLVAPTCDSQIGAFEEPAVKSVSAGVPNVIYKDMILERDLRRAVWELWLHLNLWRYPLWWYSVICACLSRNMYFLSVFGWSVSISYMPVFYL